MINIFKNNNFVERSIMGALSFLKESIFSDEFASKRGLLQLLDERLKVLIFLSLLLSVLFLKSILFITCVYAFCLLLTVLSSINLGFFLKRTWIFIPLFSLFIALPALFDIFSPGEPVLSFSLFQIQLNITKQGILGASLFFSRVLTSVSLCVLLVLTTRHYALLKVLRVFKVPQVFVMTLGMCYRYIYLFLEIIYNTYMAIKSRVGTLRSIKKGHRVVTWNIASLWQHSIKLNEEVYKAMISRGYSGEPKVGKI